MRIVRSISHFALALAIIAFSCGFTVSRMQCNMSGEITVQLFKVNDCCSDESNEENSIESSCCNITSFGYALDAFSFSKFNPDFSLVSSTVASLSEIISFDSVYILNNFPSITVDHPPPLYGTQLLHLIGILII
jgi:hypothetical protein